MSPEDVTLVRTLEFRPIPDTDVLPVGDSRWVAA
jgi:hypothetical protein